MVSSQRPLNIDDFIRTLGSADSAIVWVSARGTRDCDHELEERDDLAKEK